MFEHGSTGRRPRQAERGERWGRIPAGVLASLRDGRLRHVDVAVLAAVGVLAGGRDSWSGSIADLARTVGVDRHTAAGALDRLAAAGALTVTRTGRYLVTITTREGNAVALDGNEITIDGNAVTLDGNEITIEPEKPTSSKAKKTSRVTKSPSLVTKSPSDGNEITLPTPIYRERRDIEDLRGEALLDEPHGVSPFPLSGDTPDTPVSLDDLPPLSQVDTIPWAILREGLVPDGWLRDPTIRRTLNVLLNERVAADPSHPWYGCALVRSPHTLGGWRIIPDPSLQPRDIIPS
ncbi:MAG: hypothetical protein KatS3mg064_0609 [Tepidiforma sp.]|nr:hypothetical protein [Tepidiforma sp.]GIW17452.1 MAG: hypothetical protein KatS3mg064_0609 [Tepidiforma sp.]